MGEGGAGNGNEGSGTHQLDKLLVAWCHSHSATRMAMPLRVFILTVAGFLVCYIFCQKDALCYCSSDSRANLFYYGKTVEVCSLAVVSHHGAQVIDHSTVSSMSC